MKKLAVILVMLTGFNAMAGAYDHQATVCRSGDVELTLTGKMSLFSSRNLTLTKGGQVLLDESYDVEEYVYHEKSGQYLTPMSPELETLIRYAARLKPRSVTGGMDHLFRISDNAIVYNTFDSLMPAYGGETPALILQLIQSKKVIVFDVPSQCKTVAL